MRKILIIVGSFLALVFLVAAKYDYFLEMGEKTVKSLECSKCHKVIYGEWSQNFHAKAYVNEPFKKASKDYGVQGCVSCHAAQETAKEKALKVRPVNKEVPINSLPSTSLSKMNPCSNPNFVRDATPPRIWSGRGVVQKRRVRNAICRGWRGNWFRAFLSLLWCQKG